MGIPVVFTLQEKDSKINPLSPTPTLEVLVICRVVTDLHLRSAVLPFDHERTTAVSCACVLASILKPAKQVPVLK